MKLPLFKKDSGNQKDISVSLTPIGKSKAEQFALEGPKFDILAQLLESGTASIEELSRATGHSINKTKEICKSLARNGYLKFLSTPE